MPRNSRIHKLNVISVVSNQKEKSHSSHSAVHEVGATFAPHKTWLRILHEHNSEILNTYKEVFWFIPTLCMFPLELALRSFAGYIECQQYITESIAQRSKAANLSALRIERTHSGIRAPVDSFEHAMDIAIGAEGEPWVEPRAARLVIGTEEEPCVKAKAARAA
jgi:hypothetical protein